MALTQLAARLLPFLPKPVPAGAAGSGGAIVSDTPAGLFYGWRVVGGAFVLAAFGWGIGYYGPPIFLGVLGETRGWALSLISAAVSLHFLVGAAVSANLPRLYRRFGAATVTKAAAASLAIGLCGWAACAAPWQLFAASLLSGAGWGMMGGAAVNGILAPWFVRARPAALGVAYNGASLGGMILSPLWVAGIAALGFPNTAALVAVAMGATMWILADQLFARTPEAMGLLPDGDSAGAVRPAVKAAGTKPLPGALLWHDRRFLTLAAGMALGLFAQIGLLAHLFSLLMPALGKPRAGLAMGLVGMMAIAGRLAIGWGLPPDADRRLWAALGYVMPLAGSLLLIAAAGTSVPLLWLGVILFGAGCGNSNTLPPLVAQREFAEPDVQRAVALIVGISQAAYAFAPAVFGLVRDVTGTESSVFLAAALMQALAIAAFLAGRRPEPHRVAAEALKKTPPKERG